MSAIHKIIARFVINNPIAESSEDVITDNTIAAYLLEYDFVSQTIKASGLTPSAFHHWFIKHQRRWNKAFENGMISEESVGVLPIDPVKVTASRIVTPSEIISSAPENPPIVKKVDKFLRGDFISQEKLFDYWKKQRDKEIANEIEYLQTINHTRIYKRRRHLLALFRSLKHRSARNDRFEPILLNKTKLNAA